MFKAVDLRLGGGEATQKLFAFNVIIMKENQYKSFSKIRGIV